VIIIIIIIACKEIKMELLLLLLLFYYYCVQECYLAHYYNIFIMVTVITIASSFLSNK
jgi:hypothetical protein